ncbi:hypothetical protein DPMN_169748 [Dreissena polymorpha]|uniref:Uncharacterized protein n=1 Tax=Dreissena polymorpha TaxID=45954 RepID=A0A9D4DV62_DREPO|nr:hypothetical protein DPMN_169748 [Dreissena polymorpha]
MTKHLRPNEHDYNHRVLQHLRTKRKRKLLVDQQHIPLHQTLSRLHGQRQRNLRRGIIFRSDTKSRNQIGRYIPASSQNVPRF